MSAHARLEPRDLTRDELLDIVEQVRDTLWPDGHPDVTWTHDTLNAIAELFIARKLSP